MKILVTGTTAGLNDETYIQEVLDRGAAEGLSIEYHNLIDELELTHDKTLPKMLGTTNYIFELLREREYCKIGFKLQENRCEHEIIRVPATILWNRVNLKLKDHKEIQNFIKPDVIVTLIDAEWLMQNRLQDTEYKTDEFHASISRQNLTLQDILSWMNEEVSLSEDWAERLGIRHYVLPIGQGSKSLFNLVKYGNIPSFYVSYSMTHADEAGRNEINGVIKQLSNYGLVIDPQAIEISSAEHSKDDLETIYSYTVHRDLHWFVGKVDAVVAIHPYYERPPLSTGMMDELGHARDYHKRRYMIFPPIKQSPFTTDSYIEKGHVFQNSHEFFLTLEAEGFTPLPDKV